VRLQLLKTADKKVNPREVAQKIIDNLPSSELISKVREQRHSLITRVILCLFSQFCSRLWPSHTMLSLQALLCYAYLFFPYCSWSLAAPLWRHWVTRHLAAETVITNLNIKVCITSEVIKWLLAAWLGGNLLNMWITICTVEVNFKSGCQLSVAVYHHCSNINSVFSGVPLSVCVFVSLSLCVCLCVCLFVCVCFCLDVYRSDNSGIFPYKINEIFRASCSSQCADMFKYDLYFDLPADLWMDIH